MWVMASGSVAVKDGIELIVLAKDDYFALLEHGSIEVIELYGNDGLSKRFESLAEAFSLWPSLDEEVDKELSWADLVEAEQEVPPDITDTVKSEETSTHPIPGQKNVRESPPPVTPSTEARVYTQVSGRLVGVPILIETPATDHKVFNELKPNGSLASLDFGPEGKKHLKVPYKRVRLGRLVYRVNDDGTSTLETDPNRIDVSRGSGPSMRVNRSFNLFT
jgi:hypothetical protein